MDRDQRWERVKETYDLLVHGKGNPVADFEAYLNSSYKEGTTDEFIKAAYKADSEGNATTTISEGDVVLFFNFRTDRGRELTQVLMYPLSLDYVTLTNYDDSFQNIKVVFDKDNLSDTLGRFYQ